MRKANERYTIEGIDFDNVYNRNELVVRHELKSLIEDEQPELTTKDICDVYALTLNDFPAHYVHSGTIVLSPNVERDEVMKQLRNNILYVQSRPKD